MTAPTKDEVERARARLGFIAAVSTVTPDVRLEIRTILSALDAAERERDEAKVTAETRGRLLDEHRAGCAWMARAEKAEARVRELEEELARAAGMRSRQED